MNKKSRNVKLTDTLKALMRNEFVQGIQDEKGLVRYPTLEELHKVHKVAKSTLYRVANKENWKFEREKYQQELVAKLDEKDIEQKATESRKFDTTSLNIAKSLMATVGQAINKNAMDINEGKKSLFPSQINALANTAFTAQRLAKLALGEITHNVNINANIQQEAFREAMELLDELEAAKRDSSLPTTH
jgi:hypothetical protein